MAKLLEVIVTSVEEAVEAEAGGADRLELVREFELGGLTPDTAVVRAVLDAVTIPVRVMLRETPTLSAGNTGDLVSLQRHAEGLSRLSIDGIVVGFLRDGDGEMDENALQAVLGAAPRCRFTFHRAFDELAQPFSALHRLKKFPQVDRVLTTGGRDSWSQRRERLISWQRTGEPSLTVLVGAGIYPPVFASLRDTPELREVHVGRAARLPQEVSGRVDRAAVSSLKSALQ